MASETKPHDPERIYLEPWPYSPEGRLWSEENVWPLYAWPPEPEGESERATGVEYIRADLHAAEIARLRAIIEADGLDPDAPMPPGLTVVNERLRCKLKEAWRERSAARAEALTAQASLRRVERELEEARERERALREALCRALDRGFPSDTHEGDCAVTRGMQCDCWIGQARALAARTNGGSERK